MSIVLTLLPILISLAALYLSLHTFRASRPNWVVEMGTATLLNAAGARAAIVVEVINAGGSDGTIQRISLRCTDGTYSTRFDPDAATSIRGLKLPVTLAPTEKRTWTFDYHQIRAEVDATDRMYAPQLTTVLASGINEVRSKSINMGRPHQPAPPTPFRRVPSPLRPSTLWAASRIRRFRAPHPQLTGLSFFGPEAVAAAGVPVHVRNFGSGTARDLRVDMVSVPSGGGEVRVEEVGPQTLKRLRPGKDHTFIFPAATAAPPVTEGVQYWWRLHVGGHPSGARVGVASPEDVEGALQIFAEPGENFTQP